MLLKEPKFKDKYFLFSHPKVPLVIFGVNQNVYSEVNLDYIKKNKIQIFRRAGGGGGGAVYVDPGNLTYSFFDTDDGTNYLNFKKYAQPIINVLKKLGVDAQMSGRNDLTVDGKKFSGMAALKIGDRFYCGGTLMVDVDLDAANKALNPPKSKLASKGISSVHSRVTNLRSYFKPQYKDITIDQIREMILQEVFDTNDVSTIPTYKLTQEDIDAVNAQVKKSFGGPDWVMGKQYHDDYFHSNHYDGVGNIEFSFSVDKGIITHAKIFGDFNRAGGNLKEIEDKLTGTPYKKDNLVEAFRTSSLEHNIGKVTPEQMTDLLLDAKYQEG